MYGERRASDKYRAISSLAQLEVKEKVNAMPYNAMPYVCTNSKPVAKAVSIATPTAKVLK